MAETHKIDESGVNGLKSTFPNVRASKRTAGGVWLRKSDGTWQAVEEGETVTETEDGFEVKSSSRKSSSKKQSKSEEEDKATASKEESEKSDEDEK